MTADMILVPKAQLARMARTRVSRSGRILREWFFTGVPSCTVRRDPEFGIVDVTFFLPIDVPSKPRTTQKSTWIPSYQNYIHWRDFYRSGVRSALKAAGVTLVDHVPQSPQDTLFWPALSHEPTKGRSKKVYDPPLVVSGLILTKYEGDVDNRIKAVLDASNGILFPDDRSVCWPSLPVLAARDADASCTVRLQYVPLDQRRERILAQSTNFPSFWSE